MRRRAFQGVVGLALAVSIINLVSLAGADSAPPSLMLSATFEPLPESTGMEIMDQVDPITLFSKADSHFAEFWLESKHGVREKRRGWSPVLAADGSVVYADSEDLSLKQLLTNGEEKELLSPGSAGGFLRISPDRRFIGYAIPVDLPPGSSWVGIYGAGIMDLETGQVVASRIRDDFFTSPIGWYGDQLIVTEWDGTKTQDSLELYTLGTDGKFSVFSLGLPGASTYPGVSLDQQWMAYGDRNGNTILVNLKDTSFGTIPQVKSPSWTNQGLTGLVDGRRVLIKVTSEP